MNQLDQFFEYMDDENTAESLMKTMQQSNGNPRTLNVFYHYRRMDFGGSTTVRFLPLTLDVGAEVRAKFTLPKKTIRLRFIDPDAEGETVVLTVPVMTMYVPGKSSDDPILKQVQALYRESDRLAKAGRDTEAKAVRECGSYHWMRGEHLAQGFVVRAGMVEKGDIPENPIRVFELNKQLINRINTACDPEGDPDMALRFWPVHAKMGSNFVIKKTKSGEWPNYTSSGFASQPSAWTPDQRAAIATYGLWDLTRFLPPCPSVAEYEALTDIVRQSIAGQKVWNPLWESDVLPFRFYRTAGNGHGTDSEPMSPEFVKDQVGDAVTKAGGYATRSEGSANQPYTNGEANDNAGNASGDVSPLTGMKSGEQVREMAREIRRKTAEKAAEKAGAI
jgi:hypothetical protein